MLREVLNKRVLLLQGPNGPFFMRFAAALQGRGCTVTKVNFNSGDDLFYWGGDLVRFRQPMQAWPDFVRELMVDRQTEVVFAYGDQRPIHRQAIAVARQLGVTVFALEEGYLRPDHVTFERDGANANSRLPKDPAFYRRATAELPEPTPPTPVGSTFGAHACWTTFHAVAFTFLWFRYPSYQHHRDINAFKQAFFWLRAGYRKLRYQQLEHGTLERITGRGAPPFFLLPLQVYCDSQLQHSKYANMGELITEVVATFAAHAPTDNRLVLKHHPHDRGYTDYTAMIDDLTRRHGLGGRIDYVHDIHLPTLLKNARGVITMNSTVGLSALYHGAPLKVLGEAVYDFEGLTCQEPLADFLRHPGAVDDEQVNCFIRYLRATNQINGSFYRRTRGFDSCGLAPAAFEDAAPISGEAMEPAKTAASAADVPSSTHSGNTAPEPSR